MSQENASSKDLLKELWVALKEAGLPLPQEFIGHHYRFTCEHGSHFHVLCGTVLAIEFSDEGGLQLYVSNPRFWGAELISIVGNDNNNCWEALVKTDGEDDSSRRFFRGELEIL